LQIGDSECIGKNGNDNLYTNNTTTINPMCYKGIRNKINQQQASKVFAVLEDRVDDPLSPKDPPRSPPGSIVALLEEIRAVAGEISESRGGGDGLNCGHLEILT
jgi:hypothetical protein